VILDLQLKGYLFKVFHADILACFSPCTQVLEANATIFLDAVF
jgi:hypothetical protein